MCLAIPMELVSLDGPEGMAVAGGVRRRGRLDLVPDARVGQYVLIHAGYAIQVMDVEEAAETIALLDAVAAGGEQ